MFTTKRHFESTKNLMQDSGTSGREVPFLSVKDLRGGEKNCYI